MHWGSCGNVYALLFPTFRWPERKKDTFCVRYWAIPEYWHIICEAHVPCAPKTKINDVFLATP